MRSLVSTLIIFMALNATAQKIRFTDNTNQWTTLSLRASDLCSFQNSFTYGTDTSVLGVTYRSMQELATLYVPGSCMGSGGCSGGSGLLFNYLVREDTTAGIVYYINPTDSAAHILFNYNMGIGDSITYILQSGVFTDSVATIDSTLINGVYHKIFNMQNKVNPTNRYYNVVEGLGCTNSPTFPAWFPGCFEYGESLVCFYNHGTYPAAAAPINSCASYNSYPCSSLYIPSFSNTAGCVSALTASNIKELPRAVTISPNPAYDHIDVTSDKPFSDNTDITVYDMTGRVVYQIPAEQQNTVTINTSLWPAGLYMVIVQDNTGIVKKEKVVVQH